MSVRFAPPVSPSTVYDYAQATDDQLMILVQHADQKAFAELMARHHGLMLKIIRKYCGKRIDAEDMIQDVALSVWQHRDRWRAGEARFSTWLYTVTTNKCVDVLRKKTEDYNSDHVMDTAQDDSPTAFDRVAQREVGAALHDLLAQLPTQQKLALEMFYYHDADIADICQSLSASESAVRSYLKRGKQNLRARMSA